MSEGRVDYRSGGGCLILFGLPFFAFGSFAVISPWMGAEWGDGNGNPANYATLAAMGTLFASIGALFMFGRTGVSVDRDLREVVSWWGLLVPFSSRRHSTDDFELVSLSHEVRRSKNSSYSVYPVRLVPKEGDEAVDVTEVRSDHAEGRRQAERVAKCLGLGLRDETGATPVVREAGTLDRSLCDAGRDDPPDDPGPPPPGLDVRREGSAAIVEVPAPGVGPPHAVLAVMCVGFSVIPAAVGFGFVGGLPEAAYPYAHVAVGLFFVAFVLGPISLAAGVVLSAMEFQTIRVTPEGVTLVRTGRFRIRETQLSLDEAEEVEVHAAAGPRRGGQGIRVGRQGVVRLSSDETRLDLGRGLDAPALGWLRELIRCQAAGRMPQALE